MTPEAEGGGDEGLPLWEVELERYCRVPPELAPRWHARKVRVRADSRQHARTKAKLKNSGWRPRGVPRRVREE